MISVDSGQKVHHVTATDGVQLGCFVGGQGRPLLLVHGTAADHRRWAPVMPELQKRFTTYALDRRGRGASGDTPGWSFDQEVADIVTVIESIAPSVDVVAHSMGGALSLEAATRTSAIRRLVVYEPALVGMPPGALEATVGRLRNLLETGDRDLLLQTFMREVVHMPEQQIQLLKGLPAWEGRVQAAHTLVRELGFAPRYRFEPERIARITVPTLILAGGDSPAPMQAGARLVHDTIPGSALVVMPGQQHIAMDTGTPLFLDAVLGFLN